MPEKPPSLFPMVLAGILSGAVISTCITLGFTEYKIRTEAEARSRHDWKEATVSQLLGPMIIQFNRTKRAFDRYTERNHYLEAKVLKEGNETVRGLLLSQGHLIPPDLLEDAARLIEHYDVWLEMFEKQRGGSEPDMRSTFVFAGPEGYPFPGDSEDKFRKRYHQIWNELYGNR